MPLLGNFGCISPLHDIVHRPHPNGTVLWRKHVVGAIQRKNRCSGSSWARDREKGQDNKKSQLYLYYLGELLPPPNGPI